jgi:hypothetical protein
VRLKLLFTALVALVFGSITASFDIAPAAAGGTYTYDVSAIARVGVHEIGAIRAIPASLSVARQRSASSAAVARGASTTPLARSVATEAETITNTATMDSFLDNGATVSQSGTATAIGDDANTLTNFDRSQGAAGHDVIVHGQTVHGEAQFITNGMPTHPQQIADAVLSNPSYVPGSPVQLVTCNGTCGLADQLSQALGGARVTASPGLVDLDPATGLLRSWK